MTCLRPILEASLLRAWMLCQGRRNLRSFQRQLDHPRRTQEQTLQTIIARNKNTLFGLKYDFHSIRCEGDYRSRLPIHTYEDLRPYIERQATTQAHALNPTPPVLYLQTSGTTGKPKTIPICRNALRAFRKTQSISSYLQHEAVPGIFAGKLLAIASAMIEGIHPNGTPLGSASGLVRSSLPWIIRRKAIPPEQTLETFDYDERYRVVSAIALCAGEISCIASANPSTLLRLIDVINAHLGDFLNFFATGIANSLGLKRTETFTPDLQMLCTPTAPRLAALRQLAAKQGQITFADLWPKLRGVVTWTGGNCSLIIPKLTSLLPPEVRIIDLGYLSSEFWGTIVVDPLNNRGAPTIGDNFFEFIEAEAWERGNQETLLLSQLEVGRRYYIVTTTHDGLYRYFIDDIIEAGEYYRNTPTIAFSQKGKGVTSFTGEKLYEGQVIEAVQQASRQQAIDVNSFIVLADRQTLTYTLYVESRRDFELKQFAGLVNAALSAINIEFRAKTQSGRLKAIIAKRVKLGTFDAYKQSAVASGQREGQFKMLHLQYRSDIEFPFEMHVC